MSPKRLLDHFEQISEAPDAVPRLRRFILDLAVRGKLVEQDPMDESAAELLSRLGTKVEFATAENDEVPFDIPKKWVWTALQNMTHVEMGQSPPSESYNKLGNGIPFYQGKADFGTRYPSPRYWCNEPTKIAEKNDILISVRAPVGPTNVATERCCVGRGLAALRPRKCLDIDYFLYCLRGFEQSIADMGFGTTFVAINKKQLTSFLLPLPPLAEQHRIVTKADELMKLCDELEATQAKRERRRDRLVAATLHGLNNGVKDEDSGKNLSFDESARFYFNHLPRLSTRPEHIQQLRQTVLSLAVQGKLVPQDSRDEPAVELLRRMQENKAALVRDGRIAKSKQLPPIREEEKAFQIPTTWAWARLGDLCELVTSGSRDWAQHYSEKGAIFVRMGNLSRGNYRLRLNNIQYVKPPADREGTRTRLEEGDVLISITGEVGLLGLIPPNFGEAYINQHTCLVRLLRLVRTLYIPELFRSPFAEQQFNAPQRGIKNSYRLTDITEFIVSLPPLAEQHRIVARVDELMKLCDELELRITTTSTTRNQLLEATLTDAISA